MIARWFFGLALTYGASWAVVQGFRRWPSLVVLILGYLLLRSAWRAAPSNELERG